MKFKVISWLSREVESTIGGVLKGAEQKGWCRAYSVVDECELGHCGCSMIMHKPSPSGATTAVPTLS